MRAGCRRTLGMNSFRNIVIGCDGSDGARRALMWTTAQFDSGWFTAVYANDGERPTGAHRCRSQMLLNTVWTEPARRQHSETSTALIDDSAVRALTDAAHDLNASAIVVGHHSETPRWSNQTGSVATRLLNEGPHPVIVVNQSTTLAPMTGPLIVAIVDPSRKDFSELDWALAIATERSLAVHLVTVNDGHHQPATRELKHVVDRVRREHPHTAITAETRHGTFTSQIVAAAVAQRASLVVTTHQPSKQDQHLENLSSVLDCPTATVPPARLRYPAR